MNAIKKLFIVVIGGLLISFGCNSAVNATETVNLEDLSEIISSETDEDAASSEMMENELSDEDILPEDLLDTDEYEIYVDEQGQVYYIKKEPAVYETDGQETEDSEESGKSKSTKKKEEPSYSESDLRLLACLVYAEAGNQSYEGMLAVANVVLNRVKSPIFAHVNTIKEAIFDNKWGVQFTVTIKSSKTGKSMLDRALECYDTGVFPGKNPEAERKCMNRAIKAAKAALSGENNISDFLYFRLNNSKASTIKKKYQYIIIGDHIFYRTK